LGLLLLGDRLVAAAIDAGRLETFVVEAENAGATLRAELDQRRLRPRSVALGLPRAAVTVKPIELPSVGGELREMVRFDLERHLPYPAEDAAFDVLELPRQAGIGETNVLLAAADRRIVERALRVAEEAKLRPISLTVAVHDLLALVHPTPRGHVVWVHRVGETVELLFLAGPHIVLSRSLGTADAAQVVSEIQRSLGVVRWRAANIVWLSGDRWDDAVPALGELGVAVTEPPYTARARAKLAQLDDGLRGALELAVATASGHGIRPLDLLPPVLKPRRFTREQLVTAGMAAATILLGIGALLAPGWRESRHLAAINARIAKLDPEVRAVEQVVRELERKRRLLAAIEAAEANSVRPLPALHDLTELLPNDAWVTTIALDPKGVEITGQAAAAAALIPVLENSPRFERVEFASPVTRGRDREQFRIRAAWEGGAAAAAAAPFAAAGLPPAAAPPPSTPPAPAPRAAAPGAASGAAVMPPAPFATAPMPGSTTIPPAPPPPAVRPR
jgi:Tfp pilus assembly protein PilN